jgi:phosphoribosylanthranilate isomerase
VTRVKFCGLTRPEDAAAASEQGAAYVGVIFAPSPRQLSPERAARVLDGAGGSPARVGVFATLDAEAIADVVAAASLDVVQLHGDPSADDIERLRARTGARIWGVTRVRDGALPDSATALARSADALVLDAWSGERLGGTGQRFDWDDVARRLAPVRASGEAALVLAGGLTPDNVREAIRLFEPDVVDVSSGVELAPGIKHHERMRDFADAVRGTALDNESDR